MTEKMARIVRAAAFRLAGAALLLGAIPLAAPGLLAVSQAFGA